MPKTRRPRTVLLEPISDETAERVARILGGTCAMSLALEDLRARRAAGETEARIWKSGHSIVVLSLAQDQST